MQSPSTLTAQPKSAPKCVCLEHIGDNGPCPVHGDPYKQLTQKEIDALKKQVLKSLHREVMK